MTERPQRLDPRETESKGAKAKQIYDTLFLHNGNATLYSPGLIFVGPYNEVDLWKPEDDVQKRVMIQRGFRPEDLTRGIVNIKQGDFDDGPFKQIALTPDDKLKVANISHGLGNPEQKLLQRGDIRTIKTALIVSAIPLEIATEFGSYDAFHAKLSPQTDMKFLAAPEDPKTSSLYPSGLEAAVTSTLHQGSDYQTTAKIATDFLTQLAKAEKAGKL